jgi:hypothetical protein
MPNWSANDEATKRVPDARLLMSFVVPGKILEEYTVRNNRLGLVGSAMPAVRFSSTWFPKPISETTSGFMWASQPNASVKNRRS